MYIYTHHVPKCMGCHKAIVVITGRAHFFRDSIIIYIYIYMLCFHGFVLSVKYCCWATQENLFAQTNQDSTVFPAHENSKIFNLTSNCYICIFNNRPPANWVAHLTREFLACYSCSYYSSMLFVCTLIHGESFICLDHLECQGTD